MHEFIYLQILCAAYFWGHPNLRFSNSTVDNNANDADGDDDDFDHEVKNDNEMKFRLVEHDAQSSPPSKCMSTCTCINSYTQW